MHYDPTKCLVLQIRDRMRDLLEVDSVVQTLPFLTIHSLWKTDVTEEEMIRVSLSYPGGNTDIAAAGTHEKGPELLLCVQRYMSRSRNGERSQPGENGEGDAAIAMDACIEVTETIVLQLLKYQSDPTPLSSETPVRLWDEMQFLRGPGGRTTHYDVMPSKFAYSLTYFALHSYQRNPL